MSGLHSTVQYVLAMADLDDLGISHFILTDHVECKQAGGRAVGW